MPKNKVNSPVFVYIDSHLSLKHHFFLIHFSPACLDFFKSFLSSSDVLAHYRLGVIYCDHRGSVVQLLCQPKDTFIILLSLFHIIDPLSCNFLQVSGRVADCRQNCIPHVDFH